MKKIMSITMGILLCLSAPAHSEQNSLPQGASTDAQFEKCINAEGCSLQDSLLLLTKLDTQASQNLKRISALCAETGYIGCVGAQRNEFEQWHKNQDRMASLVKKIEAGSLSQQNSIAGAKTK